MDRQYEKGGRGVVREGRREGEGIIMDTQTSREKFYTLKQMISNDFIGATSASSSQHCCIVGDWIE
jgi:hypothetical protein